MGCGIKNITEYSTTQSIYMYSMLHSTDRACMTVYKYNVGTRPLTWFPRPEQLVPRTVKQRHGTMDRLACSP